MYTTLQPRAGKFSAREACFSTTSISYKGRRIEKRPVGLDPLIARRALGAAALDWNMPRASQACDPCKRRKVRCNGERNCQQCTHLGLTCQYSEIDPAARTRRRVIQDSVINQHRGLLSVTPRRVESRLEAAELGSSFSKPSHINNHFVFDGVDFTALVNDYSNRVFPFLPVISSARLRSLISNKKLDGEDGALVHAVAAVTMNMTRVQTRHHNNESDQIQRLYKSP